MIPSQMETPLDVLSRAASMLETTEINSSFYKRCIQIDPRDSPNREVRAKCFKTDRLKDISGSSEIQIDERHFRELRIEKTTAGTQTQLSSINGRNDMNYRSYYYENENCLPPPPPPPPLPLSVDLHEQKSPLNLSLSNTNNTGENNVAIQYRSDVLTCPTTLPPRYPVSHHSTSINTSQAKAVVTDPLIDEHFRRSLGTTYRKETVTQNTGTDVSPIDFTSPDDPNSSIAGSVDDHFAKSLGDTTWTAIKAKNDLVALDMFTGTVDDHFAKALGGETWLKIKAKKENSCSASPEPCTQQQFML
ncbi:hypothetical protein SNE40_014022 [Patella caerulea]|uniref:Transcription cofactor vestigial-like protein 4 n=2 Tax=Patella caerulea TaxID=87958 RepID=A0AAN8JJD9_PATCE